MTCEEFVTALSADVQPVGLLVEHAAGCSQCGPLWQAEILLRGSAPSAHAPPASPELQRLFAAHAGARRATHPLRRMLAVLGAVSACIALGLWRMPRADLREASTALLVLPSAAFALLLIAGLQLFGYRGRAGLGAPPWLRWTFAAIAVGLYEALVAFEVAKDAPWNASLGAARIAPSHDCLALGLAVSCLVGAVALGVARRTVLIGAASSGALAGSVAGLAAVMFLHLHCAGSVARHLTIAHGLPLVCAIGLGVLAGRRILAA